MTKFENLRNDKRTGAQFAYVLDSIFDPETGEQFATDLDAARAAWEMFDSEKNSIWDRKQYPRLSERVGQWLQGLPSGVAIAFSNSDIIDTGRAWGYCQTDKKTAEFVNNWFTNLGFRFVQVWTAAGLL